MGDVEIPGWLKGLPLAPEFRPTDTEFADPIAYISKIEKEASGFGICKVIPPLPKPSKRYVLSNLNKSLSKCPELGSDENSLAACSSSKMESGDRGNEGEVRAVFTTRHQELGQSAKRTRGAVQPQQPAVHKQVWQSGEIYTFEQFETKSKAFARSLLGIIKEVSPLVIEAMFWKAASEKPIHVEYANDVPGSGFGEPEGSFRYFRRRRGKRAFHRNSRESSDCKKQEVGTIRNSDNDENKETTSKNAPILSSETSKTSTRLPTSFSDETSQFSRQKNSSAGNEMEGTAGWKLSNSPWNLQVIARSPGSLTRFMPDDIPGVTSPMVYIGMLFSWFAWHVEDHELHSLNFLHTGSPKTWYAVPGDYAFAFEEVIRTQAYGGNIDRLAALTLLGEKTTLLSPEVVVASGIPCCRLIQNPGEFVVTFPRAYHVGFSHGFNCGEAANFGTPQWLKVAKEAAVRRAAMNYLPMLSHQQLLYLLTMSFVSRVPRSLLPGARSSRLRDRQKEERELLVKKAFIEDMLNENSLLYVLLGKESTYHAVLWDPESLPSPSKEIQLRSEISTDATTPRENVSYVHSENDNHQNDLFDQMSLYMETVNDLYLDDDNMFCDFQVDSGTLACVACGILGFPFMSVVQPSERASMELLPADHLLVQGPGVSTPVKSHSSSDLGGTVKGCVSDTLDNQDETQKGKISSACKGCIPMTGAPKSGRDFKLIKDNEESSIDANSLSSVVTDTMELKESNLLHYPIGVSSNAELNQSTLCSAEDLPTVPELSLPPEDQPIPSITKCAKGWNTSSGFLRPRIFCLEHAVEIEELLQSKGGAKVLVICHSDYQKIKAHAAAIAEEIGSSFNYNEIPLDSALKEDLNLINLAIDDEEHDERGEDWTSKLGINLRYCVKIGKNSPSKKVQHALTLGGLFSDTTPCSNVLNLKWPSRRFRSKRKLNHPVHLKPCESIQIKNVEVLGGKLDGRVVRKEGKIIQYSRRSFKLEPGGSAGASKARGRPKKQPPKEVSAANCGDLDKNCGDTSDNNLCNNENTGSDSVELSFFTSVGKSEMQHEIQVLGATRDLSENSVPAHVADSLAASTPVVEGVEDQMENQTLEEMNVKGKACNLATWDISEMQHEMKVAEETSEKHEISCADKSASSLVIANPTIERIEMQRENRIVEESNMTNEACTLENSEEQCAIQADGDVLMNEVSDLANSAGSHAADPVVGSFNSQMEKAVVEKSCISGEVCDSVTLDNAVQQEIHSTNRSSEKEPVSSNVTLINQPTLVSMEETSVVLRETHAAEDAHCHGEACSLQENRELENIDSTVVDPSSTARKDSKRKREVEQQTENKFNVIGFIRSPCEGLRSRAGKDAPSSRIDINRTVEENPVTKKVRKPSDGSIPHKDENKKGSYRCDLEGCRMSFKTKAELLLHKRNRCPHQGCRKRFSSHKYAVLHQRVHDDERPLKCSWKGCTMSFKWAWARTEHLRVHTGERPYHCKVEGCDLTFRFVSDFSRHRRKMGHYVNLPT